MSELRLNTLSPAPGRVKDGKRVVVWVKPLAVVTKV